MTMHLSEFDFGPARFEDRQSLERTCQSTFEDHARSHPATFSGSAEAFAKKMFKGRFRRTLFSRQKRADGITVVRSGSRIVGYVVADVPKTRLGNDRTTGTVAIADIYIEPEFRRIGLARRLLASAKDELKNRGFQHFTAVVWGQNTASKKLFDKKFSELFCVYEDGTRQEPVGERQSIAPILIPLLVFLNFVLANWV